ncbi:MAG: hypothetical protein FWF08_00845 [Oscillospiraceae bacterium]|nr:hypothetical protein [Oscillospiraceae bacterium]
MHTRDLREKYPVFYYNGYSAVEKDGFIKLEWNFQIPGLSEFAPSVKIKTKNLGIVNPLEAKFSNSLIFNLGLAEIISYYKAVCPPKIVIRPGAMSGGMAVWWKKLFFNGLSEFFYINNISAGDDFFEFEYNKTGIIVPETETYNKTGKNLIPVGGGKDSAVTAELLSNFKSENMFFTINSQQARTDTVIAAGYDENSIIETTRTISPELLELNKRGFLNGHTPFSAIVAFLSLFCAYLTGAENIILSNEASANEGNMENSKVNHQYSKSFEFERDFNSYVKKYLTDDINYFSILRPFSELQIAKMFSAHEKYHSIFKSCNTGGKTNIWCGNCPKCLFVYILLSPFLSGEKLVSIFGGNLLNNEGLKGFFDGLAGFSPVKPFECVGTVEEVRLAISITAEKYKSEGREMPALLKYFHLKEDTKKIAENTALFSAFDNENLIPQKFMPPVKEMYDFVKP